MSNCPFCEKGGIPLYLFREAVGVRKASPVPGLGDPFVKHNDDAADPWLVVGRSLRPGYVYLYDEVRKKWRAWAVADGGYFYEFDPHQPAPSLDAVAFSCYRDTADVTLASCITVEHTARKPAGLVRIAFSDVAWTQATFDKHASADWRSEFMRSIDVLAGQQDNAQPLPRADTLIAEQLLDGATGRRHFQWSPFGFASKKVDTGFFANLIEGANKKSELRRAAGLPAYPLHADKGLIVKLRDPVAMAREIAALTRFKLDEHLTHPSRVRELALSNAIATTEATVKQQALAQATAGVADSIDKARFGYTETRMAYATGGVWVPPMPSMIPMLEARAADPTWQQKVQDDAWGRYTRKYKGDQRDAFVARYHTDCEALQREWIEPLVRWHAFWIAPARLGRAMKCNFDPKDWHQGFAYMAVVSQCVEDMAQHPAFMAAAVAMLKGDPSDEANALLRALLVNNDDNVKKIQAAAQAPLDWRALGSDNYFSGIKEALTKVNQAAAAAWGNGTGTYSEAAARLVTQLGGPLVKLLGLDSQALNAHTRTVLLAMGALGGESMEKVVFAGNKKDFKAAIVRRLMKASGNVVGENTLRGAVSAEIRRMELQRVILKGDQKLSYFMVIDKVAARELAGAAAAAGASPGERAQAIVKSLRAPEDIDKSFRAFDRISKANVRLGAITAVLQIAAWSKAAEDDVKSMQHERAETRGKLLAAYSALIGTIAETLGHAASRTQWLVMAGARGLQAAKFVLKGAQVLKYVGKIGGAAAGAIVAFWDFMHFGEEVTQKNYGMAALYGVSGVLGLAIAGGVIGYAALTAWLPVLFILLVVVIILIEIFKDNKIEDWLERTLWGTWRDEYKGADPYQSVEAEMQQFKLALEG